jgi:hypothetical protein
MQPSVRAKERIHPSTHFILSDDHFCLVGKPEISHCHFRLAGEAPGLLAEEMNREAFLLIGLSSMA